MPNRKSDAATDGRPGGGQALGKPRSAEKPVSLHPLSFKMALECLLRMKRVVPPGTAGEAPATDPADEP